MAKSTNTASQAIEVFAVNELVLSDLNPRQDVQEDEVKDLAESINACGLIQNLSGIKQDDGKIGIVAGGRRLRALQLLTANENSVAYTVPVKIAKDLAEAESWANAENIAREDLHPADEIRAYGRMAKNGSTINAIASAFAVTEVQVRKRLKLAELNDDILDALKANKINLTTAEVFTLSNDVEKTKEALDLVLEGRISRTHQLKDYLNPQAVNNTDKRAMYVGEQAYKDAGGTTISDLFSEEVLFEDPALLDDLYKQKLEDAAKALQAKGWKWVDVHFDTYTWAVVQEQKLEKLKGKASKKSKSVTGGLVYIDHEGKECCELGYLRPADRTEAEELGLVEPQEDIKAQTKAKAKGDYSQALKEDLQKVRRGALQTALLEKPELILDLLAFSLCEESSGSAYSPFNIKIGRPENQPKTDTGYVFDERLEHPIDPMDWYSNDSFIRVEDKATAFSEFQAKGKKHRNTIITNGIARTFEDYESVMTNIVGQLSEANLRSIWTPTDENFFKRVSAEILDKIYVEIMGTGSDKGFFSMKKKGKVEALHNIFNDAEIYKALTKEQKAKVDTWEPKK